MEFTIDEKTMVQYQRAVALLSNRAQGKVTAETVFAYLLEFMLERKDPVRRNARRKAREQKRAAQKPETHAHNPGSTQATKRTRTIPAATRDAVFTRDNGRCTFRGPRGQRCGAQTRSHIDHVVPFALGGSNEPENLRLLCAAHNQLMAVRVLGTHAARKRE